MNVKVSDGANNCGAAHGLAVEKLGLAGALVRGEIYGCCHIFGFIVAVARIASARSTAASEIDEDDIVTHVVENPGRRQQRRFTRGVRVEGKAECLGIFGADKPTLAIGVVLATES